MTRYNTLEGPDSYQGNRRFALSSSRQTARAHPVGPHLLPLQESSDSLVEKQRRRIAVACSRCRKRKIKCSGDPKNGMGCQNCRNAGSEPGQCQFLRVQSSNVECIESWPYLLANGPIYNPSASLGIYSGSSPIMYAPNPTTTRRLTSYWPFHHTPAPHNTDYYGYDVATHDPIFEQTYSLPPPSTQNYLLPEQGSLGNYNEPYPRQWQTSGKGERGPSAIFEQTPSTASYGASGGSYAAPLAPMGGIEHVGFPSLGNLAKSLPPSQHMQANDRMLPTPRGGPEQASTNQSLAVSHLEGPPSYLDVYHQGRSVHGLSSPRPRQQILSRGCSLPKAVAIPASCSGSGSSNHPTPKSLSSSPQSHDLYQPQHATTSNNTHNQNHSSFVLPSSTASRSAPPSTFDVPIAADFSVLDMSTSSAVTTSNLRDSNLLYAHSHHRQVASHAHSSSSVDHSELHPIHDSNQHLASHSQHQIQHQQHAQQVLQQPIPISHNTRSRDRILSAEDLSFNSNVSVEMDGESSASGSGSQRGSISSSATDTTLLYAGSVAGSVPGSLDGSGRGSGNGSIVGIRAAGATGPGHTGSHLRHIRPAIMKDVGAKSVRQDCDERDRDARMRE